jgi:hypothetical protein
LLWVSTAFSICPILTVSSLLETENEQVHSRHYCLFVEK